jgi:hypothetical protein
MKMKKKVKKLVLKKTTIANLGDFIMNQLKGGEDSAFCLDGTYLDASYAGLCTAVQDTCFPHCNTLKNFQDYLV